MKITLFGRPGCTHCVTAKNYLENKKLRYDYVDVATDLGFETLMALDENIKSVPVLSVEKPDGIFNIVGFNKEKYDELVE